MDDERSSRFQFRTLSEMLAEWDADQLLQRTLPPSDPRHSDMFQISDCREWVSIYWSGKEYSWALSRLQRPDDLLWMVHHIAKKRWRHMTPRRMSRLIEVLSHHRGFPAYGRMGHPNEAPKPNRCKVGERAKMTPQLRYAIIRRDLYRCRACGFSVQDGAQLHVDHIVPVSAGGETALNNLQTLCSACNLGKGANAR